ncbi:MAG: (E)-4-hydroxy-3-methylbut-2-enyl-diphosphate synthase [Verrucomicrobiota bacterium]
MPDSARSGDLEFCPSLFSFTKRRSREVMVGDVGIGGAHPVRLQSMITSDTLDTEASVGQAVELAEAGCEIVRVTAQTRRHAANLEPIVAGVRAAGWSTPIVADIHFKPDAAMEAGKWVEKVRVNPGNYADKKKFAVREYTDAEYAAEIDRIREEFSPLVELCKARGVAMRIGTNHGSLSDRIMNRYGDTPLGMVESALEFARIARDLDYHNFVFSMKASNPKVMIEAYRLLAARLDAEGPDWNYPLHLGVTEAGDGEDGRIKSAIGIGSLLADGIGDTIRVSLTEDAVKEIPVAQALVEAVEKMASESNGPRAKGERMFPGVDAPFDPFEFRRRATEKLEIRGLTLGASETVRVFTTREMRDLLGAKAERLGEFQPELIYEDLLDAGELFEIDPRDESAVDKVNALTKPQLITVNDGVDLPVIAAFRLLAATVDARHPVLLKDMLGNVMPSSDPALSSMLTAATNLGSLLCDGIGDAVLVRGEESPGRSLRVAFNTLQAAGVRIFKTDFVACPSCGRTLFDLQETTARIRAATGHLKGVRIAIMGCIVNGPGEMADADFGYVGGAPGKINLYVGKEAVKFNIPQAEAVDRLVDLIREHGKWVEAPEPAGAELESVKSEG